MRFNKLDLNLLVALDALLEHRSITLAAERVYLSQSAMSNALSRLRQYFDDELLVQIGRRMELTPRAEGLRDAVRDVLVRIDATVANPPMFQPHDSNRQFRIVVSDYTLSTLAPHVLALAHQETRSIRFQFLPQVDSPQRMLERGDADLLVIPNNYASTDHPTEPLVEESFCCVVCHDSRHVGRPLSLEAYQAAGHVVMQPSASHKSFESVALEQLGVERRIEVSSYGFTSLPMLLAGTDRIATVQRRLAMQLANHHPLALLDLPVALPRMDQRMQWHKYKSSDQGLLWLRQLAKLAALRMDRALGLAGAAG
ncbi:LysR family transcriptional regulator [Ramlibacter sp. MAHUQ-53]|uniref:LysR family transcriptional regulator n=1 Tax=unclassified Ramlibacter TaxID=2617605 RepID=UPI0036372C31